MESICSPTRNSHFISSCGNGLVDGNIFAGWSSSHNVATVLENTLDCDLLVLGKVNDWKQGVDWCFLTCRTSCPPEEQMTLDMVGVALGVGC